MAIDLEGIMNRIMGMVENKQKNTPSGMQVYNDAQIRAKWDAIDKVNMHKDEMSVRDREINQRDRNSLLANPASSLDSSGRNAYANAALGKMNAEAQYNLGMAAHGFGSGRQAEATGNYYQGKADTESAMRPAFQNMDQRSQLNALLGRDLSADNRFGNSQYIPPSINQSIATPSITTPSYNDETVKTSQRERDLIYGNNNGLNSPVQTTPMDYSFNNLNSQNNKLKRDYFSH